MPHDCSNNFWGALSQIQCIIIFLKCHISVVGVLQWQWPLTDLTAGEILNMIKSWNSVFPSGLYCN